jgi:predicted CXXCH cytochrome family protein
MIGLVKGRDEMVGTAHPAIRAMIGMVCVLGAWAQLAQGSAVSSVPVRASKETPYGVTTIARPTWEVEPAGCVTPECHVDVKAYKVLHGPVSVNTCDACHKLTSAKAHTFELKREKAELCTYCHEFNTGMLPVVHKPVIAGECLGCHNPHGGTNNSMTREATNAELCGRCHENVALGKKFLHHPVKVGECDTCHRPHASRYPKLLDAVGTDLCLSCHREFGAQMAKVTFKHKALEEGCTKCHDAHGSAYPMEVTQSLPDLCLSCHETIKDSTTAAYKHPAALGDRACLTCHTAHGSNLARLMSDLPVRICMNCHDKEIKMSGGGVVAAVAEVNEPAMFKHAPIRDGQCGGCHSTHGGDRPLLLRRAFPAEFYQRFSADKYDLCFGCHDEQLVENERAGGLTNFRNGDRNLHFVHVAKGDSGRSCRACHSTHASKYDRLVRDSVPFGKWQLPITFEKTPTGGMCVTGCHPAFHYDRENPVAPKATTPPIQSSPRVPAADERKPIVVTWSARSVAGSEVKVPADERPTVLLFLRADQAQSQQAVRMVLAATPQIGLAQVVAIFSGRQAEEHAKAFAATGIADWPVIADPAYALSKTLGVEVWPATLVVQDDGVLVTHVGGAPLSLTVELGAYLDLAMRKIDRAALNRRLAEHDLVGDGPVERAAWHLQMGRKLLEEGKAEEARAILADGLRFQPGSADLQVEMVRALAELKQAEQAMNLVKQLPAGAMPAWEQDLLCGRMLAVLGQWDEARRLVAAVLQQKPDLGEAHYLMGMIYEHDRDWEKAAQEYRAAHIQGSR